MTLSYDAKKAQEQALREQYNKRTQELSAIIRPLENAIYQCEFGFTYLRHALNGYANDWGGLELNPDFQRGHVWTTQQQTNFIENVLRGIVPSSGFLIQFNCPNWVNDHCQGDLPRGLQCIDGLQRISAVLDFLDGKVKPFGLHVDDLDLSSFSMKRSHYRFIFSVYDFQNKADLLDHYIAINAGGTPHSEEEILRIKKMRDETLAKSDQPKPLRPTDN